MILAFYFVSLLLSCLPLLHSATVKNISTPICPEVDINCSRLGRLFDRNYRKVKVNYTSKGEKIQLGGRSYEIVGKYDSDHDSDLYILIRNKTFEKLVKKKSCEALMNNLTPPRPSPLVYSISILPNITLFKCIKNLTSAQQKDAYFYQNSYKSYNKCKDYTFYYNYHLNGTVPNDLPNACHVVHLPVKFSSSKDNEKTNIFSRLSSLISLLFKLSPSCDKCYKKGHKCNTKNGQVHCSRAIKEKTDKEPAPTPNQGHRGVVENPGRGLTSDAGRKLPRLILAMVVVPVVCSLVVISLCLKRKTEIRKRAKYNVKVEMFLKNLEFPTPKRYSYSEVEKMTNSFKVKLGQGGFGTVYKGVLRNQNPIAVKVLSEAKGDGEDFINEVASAGMTSHVNIVSLMGFCLEGRKRVLIYEFMPNGSLERFIYSHGSSISSHIGWEKLHQIAVGIARGLEYLHRGCSTRILHFDIKPHNILLDNDFCPKISDFGLAKLFRQKESKIYMSHMRGTPGYIAPELFFRTFGDVSHKADVYSYGMMILEMVGGRKNIEDGVDHTSEMYFPHWIYKKVELHEEQLGLDGIVCDEENKIVRKMIIVGLWCIQTNPLNRPTITRVLEMLEGELASLEVPPKPYLCSPPRPIDSSTTNLLHPYCSTTEAL